VDMLGGRPVAERNDEMAADDGEGLDWDKNVSGSKEPLGKSSTSPTTSFHPTDR
jgi:hypothetical protein